MPIERLIYKVVFLLKKKNTRMTAKEIFDETGIDIPAHETLFHELSQNPKVFVHPDYVFSYQPKFNIRTLEDLRTQINVHPYGVLKSEVAEYAQAEEDIKNLDREKKIIMIQSGDKIYLFPNPECYQNLEIDKDFVEKWKAIKPPCWNDRELDEYMGTYTEASPAAASGAAAPLDSKRPRLH